MEPLPLAMPALLAVFAVFVFEAAFVLDFALAVFVDFFASAM